MRLAASNLKSAQLQNAQPTAFNWRAEQRKLPGDDGTRLLTQFGSPALSYVARLTTFLLEQLADRFVLVDSFHRIRE